jgi:carbamoyl-phosphate synthase small subunit
MMAAISSELSVPDLELALKSAPAYGDINFVKTVTTEQPYVWPATTTDTKYKVALLDCGVKFNILRSLASLGAEVTVYPSHTSAADILATNPDGVFLSPGPGDPELLTEVVENVRILMKAKPTMGICLGNQLVGCAFGGHTFKLPFGHRGSNHPVKDLESHHFAEPRLRARRGGI